MTSQSFIETQFPVSRISKESYKERKANNGQTLTGLGKWWGRKPLVLVRATIVGLLLPATGDPDADLDVFLQLMTMDDDGLMRRRNAPVPPERIAELLDEADYEDLLLFDNEKWVWKAQEKGLDAAEKAEWQQRKKDLQDKALLRMGYDEALKYCARPEQIEGPSEEAWRNINAHCGTTATNLREWVQQMGQKQFGHTPRVGDAFCGGGSIPFEAARIGCEAYGSDLNPVAALLSWAGLNIIGGGEAVQKQVAEAQQIAFDAADRQITEWGIEHNEKGWRADAYLYCVEARSPATGYLVPLAPGWVISEKYKVCAVLRPDHPNRRYHIDIVYDADEETFRKAKTGTVQDSRLVCPETGQSFGIAELRGDKTLAGKTQTGLRLWENDDLVPRPDDVFQERLYFIRYVETFYWKKIKTAEWKSLSKTEAEALPDFQAQLDSGNLKPDNRKHYCAPDAQDLAREQKTLDLLNERFHDWQQKGYIPSAKIPPGDKTDEPVRTRGWTYWHHLFNPRQLLTIGVLQSQLEQLSLNLTKVGVLLGQGFTTQYSSRLSRYRTEEGNDARTESVFYNMALNTLYNFGLRPLTRLNEPFFIRVASCELNSRSTVKTVDARNVEIENDFWITDPPYADAINYHELGDFFLAWYEKHLPKLFPEWYADSRAALAVKGKGKDFNRSMVEVYSNLNKHMPGHGAQVVMFTHQDSKVWADLALILWAAGLRVTAAWTIQTETDAGGIKKGNYVQGTVIMVLRKQVSEEVGFLNDILIDIEHGVKKQIDFMRRLDQGEDPNFGDSDYQLAAYAAALRELTNYKRLAEVDVELELGRERKSGEKGEVEKIIESAVRVAMDYLVPKGMREQVWRKLHPEERFYLKGLEIEQGGEYRSGVYTEMARGYGLHEYKHLLSTTKANETRLSTASEFKNRNLNDEGFGRSLTRQLLFAIAETVRSEDPQDGRNWIKTEWKTYWDDRDMMIHLLDYIHARCAHIAHWQRDAEAAYLLRGFLQNDTPN